MGKGGKVGEVVSASPTGVLSTNQGLVLRISFLLLLQMALLDMSQLLWLHIRQGELGIAQQRCRASSGSTKEAHGSRQWWRASVLDGAAFRCVRVCRRGTFHPRFSQHAYALSASTKRDDRVKCALGLNSLLRMDIIVPHLPFMRDAQAYTALSSCSRHSQSFYSHHQILTCWLRFRPESPLEQHGSFEPSQQAAFSNSDYGSWYQKRYRDTYGQYKDSYGTVDIDKVVEATDPSQPRLSPQVRGVV